MPNLKKMSGLKRKSGNFHFCQAIISGMMLCILIVLQQGCSKSDNSADTNQVAPAVTTAAITGITQATATGGGNVTSQGSSAVTARGICWSLSQNPAIAGSHTSDGTGTGTFTSNITGLNPNTPYNARAYATNSAGTAYGSQMSFTTTGTGTVPAVTTNPVTGVTQTSATSGNITSDGGAPVTARGVCWSTSQNPALSDPHTGDGTGAGAFTSDITGLNPNTPYFVRAYATNSVGTSYGDQKNFTTTGGTTGQPCPGLPTYTDARDGQVYPTVQIGTQCWLQKNMNYVTGNSWCYDSSATYCDEYGRLYDWQSAQGACPSGWHLAGDDEWTVLTTFLTGGTGPGTKMKSTSGWYQDGNGDNSSGFTGLPGGRRFYDGSFIYLTRSAGFWSSEYSSTQAWTGLSSTRPTGFQCAASGIDYRYSPGDASRSFSMQNWCILL